MPVNELPRKSEPRTVGPHEMKSVCITPTSTSEAPPDLLLLRIGLLGLEVAASSVLLGPSFRPKGIRKILRILSLDFRVI